MRIPLVRFTIGRLMVAVAVVALALWDARLATLLVVLTGSIAAIRSLRTERTEGRSRPWAIPYFVSLACLYLPYAWLLEDFPRDSYRLGWITLWPVLPGLLAGMFFHPNDSLEFLAAGTMALLLVALFTAWGASGRVGLVVANGVALILSLLGSWSAYQLFLF